MSTIDINALKKEKEEATEWEANAVKKAIQHIIEGPLNNEVYRKKTVGEAYTIVKEEFILSGVMREARYATTANRLLRKLAGSSTISEAVMVLGDYLLG